MIASHLSIIFRLRSGRKGLYLVTFLLITGIGGMVGPPWLANADSSTDINTPPALYQAGDNNGSGNGRDANCLMCHAAPDFKGASQNGENISLYVDNRQYAQLVHGPAGLECLACHTALSRYPHHDEEQENCLGCHQDEMGGDMGNHAALRVQLANLGQQAMTLNINESCRFCHRHKFEVAGDSAHVKVLEGGNQNAPVCVDCHGSHNTSLVSQLHIKVSAMCGHCHTAVYSTCRTSVHGAALEKDGNPDVPKSMASQPLSSQPAWKIFTAGRLTFFAARATAAALPANDHSANNKVAVKAGDSWACSFYAPSGGGGARVA